MVWLLLHTVDLLLWLLLTASVAYIAFFALASLIPARPAPCAAVSPQAPRPTFLVLFPAYGEDEVILSSVGRFLAQTYPSELYTVAVISDHMSADTNHRLSRLPVALLQPRFDQSSKAKALQYAVSHIGDPFDFVVILDADNVVESDFLCRLEQVCLQGYRAVQCHRCAKNADNHIAALDGLSEEVNNTLFRRAHNAVGLSAALVGSGMCFDYNWFCRRAALLRTTVEDRELEALLALDGIFVKYEDKILVYDEKVTNADTFQRQRLRWMSGQLQSLAAMSRHLPQALLSGNINYLDKTLQQALIPRSLLLVLVPLLSLAVSFVSVAWSIKWWIVSALLAASVFLAVPPPLRTRHALLHSLAFPRMALRMLRNLRHIRKNRHHFIHTEHHTT